MSSPPFQLTLGWLYPELMSTYGDRGNVICLSRRCEWRGIAVRLLPLDGTASVADFNSADLFIGGGAQDRQQELVMRDLRGPKAAALQERLAASVPGVFTCGAPQLLGHYYEPSAGQRIEGLGLFDFFSVHPGPREPRCIGNLVYDITLPRIARELAALAGSAPRVVGFENHGGRTFLGQVEPFGRVVKGSGNNGKDGTEGAVWNNAIATYSHGPLLPKNPFIADWLIAHALQGKYGLSGPAPLVPLDDTLAAQAREVMFRRLGLSPALRKSGV